MTYHLRAQVPILPGLAIEGGRRNFNGNTPDENFLRISYNLMDMNQLNLHNLGLVLKPIHSTRWKIRGMQKSDVRT
jgi:hypothetical protein